MAAVSAKPTLSPDAKVFLYNVQYKEDGDFQGAHPYFADKARTLLEKLTSRSCVIPLRAESEFEKLGSERSGSALIFPGGFAPVLLTHISGRAAGIFRSFVYRGNGVFGIGAGGVPLGQSLRKEKAEGQKDSIEGEGFLKILSFDSVYPIPGIPFEGAGKSNFREVAFQTERSEPYHAFWNSGVAHVAQWEGQLKPTVTYVCDSLPAPVAAVQGVFGLGRAASLQFHAEANFKEFVDEFKADKKVEHTTEASQAKAQAVFKQHLDYVLKLD